ncbi:HU family DNA-binding protein [Hydrogenovibrio marinus]|uniref:DNA-binding protein n=1 Tax=Hydrogenovibrio marinus TaxID=28885 RepID=A0A066ZX03_HYDMR|nr:HU family DNA-binding protein [Hydrogenovibrio marinus]KDN94625.1 DNA-binding protein [Hydrogenovibrio marinus]
MSKVLLADHIADQCSMSKKEAMDVIEAFTKGVTSAVANEDKIQLVGFGTFEVKERAARKGRNPQNGEEFIVEASKVVKFKPGKDLKEAAAKGII